MLSGDHGCVGAPLQQTFLYLKMLEGCSAYSLPAS